MSIIKLENASYNYKSYDEDGNAVYVTGVKNVSLSFEEGAFVALVGHNGCGKSTLAKLLNGLLIPQEGKVTVLGMDTAEKKNLFEIRKNVGMVFQNPDNQMVASIVEEDVAFGPENLGVPQPEIVERVYEALAQVDMTEYAKRTPHRLSGGQKQRVAIAGALAIRPKVLVLDESTAMLDPQGRKEVLEVAHRLNREKGMTIVLITHFMEEVLDADGVVVMNGGEIVAQGTPREIFQRAELLDKVGLRAPRTIELAQKLHACGMDVDVFQTDPKALADEVCRTLPQANTALQTEQQSEKTGEAAVDAQELCYTYNSGSTFAKQALKNINLNIRMGEFVAIVGHTGSGKTTLVQHLNALIRVQEGKLWVNGYDLSAKKVDLKGLRGSVGMVFQYPEHQLFADTVLEDVCFGPKNFGCAKEEAEQRAKTALELVGMDFDAVKGKSPFDLSGGEKRRVALAGVLAMQPKILALDEPTAGLDPQGKREILSLVKKLNQSGVTVIMVSHDMNEVYENVDRVIVIRNGEIVRDLPPARLFELEQEIVEMNLEVPYVAQFANKLRANGRQIGDVRTVEDAVKTLCGGEADVS